MKHTNSLWMAALIIGAIFAVAPVVALSCAATGILTEGETADYTVNGVHHTVTVLVVDEATNPPLVKFFIDGQVGNAIAQGEQDTLSGVQITVNSLLIAGGGAAPAVGFCLNPTDVTPPAVSITAPAENSVLSTPFTFTASASDDVAVDYIRFELINPVTGARSSALGVANGPNSLQIDPAAYASGTWTLSATAFDKAGNQRQTGILVTFKSADTTAPQVSIGYPAEYATFSSAFSISASASDNVAVTKVEFELLNPVTGARTALGTDTSAPYSVTVDPSKYASGTWTLSATASDAAGNTRQTGISTTFKSTNTVPVQCTDSDGGRNYAAQGSTYGVTKCLDQAACTPYKIADSCNGNTVNEYYCGSDGFLYVDFSYQCPSGCINGACAAATSAALQVKVIDPIYHIVKSTAAPITASVYDPANKGISSVSFYYVERGKPNTLLGIDYTAPYSITWDNTAKAQGEHSLLVEAVSIDGRKADTGEHRIYVPASSIAISSCIPDGQLDDTLYKTACCSGQSVRGSTLCSDPADWYTDWASCTQLCGTTDVTAKACPYGPTGTELCPCPSGMTNNGKYGVGVCQSQTAASDTITYDFSATVTSVDASDNLLPMSVKVGDSITGSVTYSKVSFLTDSRTENGYTFGTYSFDKDPYAISLRMNGKLFKTDYASATGDYLSLSVTDGPIDSVGFSSSHYTDNAQSTTDALFVSFNGPSTVLNGIQIPSQIDASAMTTKSVTYVRTYWDRKSIRAQDDRVVATITKWNLRGGSTACTAEYNPVCGADGKTYSNSCYASQAGVRVNSYGACERDVAIPLPSTPVSCDVEDTLYEGTKGLYSIGTTTYQVSVSAVHEGKAAQFKAFDIVLPSITEGQAITLLDGTVLRLVDVGENWARLCLQKIAASTDPVVITQPVNQYTPDTCTVSGGFSCTGFKATRESNTILTQIQNNLGVDAKEVTMKLASPHCGSTIQNFGSIANGESFSTQWTCDFSETTEQEEAVLLITYVRAGESVSHSASGQLLTRVEGTVVPAACSPLYTPVCGTDGKTYPNECMAKNAGVTVMRNEPCATTVPETSSVCAGCSSGNLCYDTGTRVKVNGVSSYCSPEKVFSTQKSQGAVCEENYECSSNQCSSGVCVDVVKELQVQRGLIQKVLGWLEKVF